MNLLAHPNASHAPSFSVAWQQHAPVSLLCASSTTRWHDDSLALVTLMAGNMPCGTATQSPGTIGKTCMRRG